MTTKIIITPASHGTIKTNTGGMPRTVRVVTVGGQLNRNQTKASVVTLPVPASVTRAVQGSRGEARTVVKRLFDADSVNQSQLTMIPSAPRKRQRLDHLTSDQKNQRRKLKNRVAAQTARDRKKMQMDVLESRVASLERQNDELLQQNNFLKKQNDLLSTQNALLQERLQELPESKPSQLESEPKLNQPQPSAIAITGSMSFESAALISGPQQKGQDMRVPALLMLSLISWASFQVALATAGNQHADLLELLTETLFGNGETPEGSPQPAATDVVGAAAEELESGDDTMSEEEAPAARLAALLDAPAGPEDDLLAQLLRGAQPDELLALQQEAAVPESPQPSPESPSLPPSPADHRDLDDLVKVKTEIDDWPMFDEEPLDNHFEDQFILFPQLVL
ncbi:cyclic AMP-responsive element-binding protein 3-like protein 4 [Pollicipes pollicipes]|uniref:cyclic AMP-responsive element-binding protein 3-like protein 4 n=1 Tax=Pollicipes pollicipes TaxID=41117 RepID=UPI0018857E55|nr:cyclic AMP-responsive element-binding protein 3-like protein 4 [Pollicipes pollicipes]